MKKFQISIESVPVTVDTFSIVVQTKKIERYLYEIVAELKQDLHLDDIQVESQQAMLAVVGRAMRQMPKAIYQQFISEERVER